ncbi:NACHT domain-containing protein [Pleomassaria siparia CBS 279.74]|uniref:NACHT domain-containing protein n=1 Tax=Pleomassaria siparia CBS 279.74 TaxID=1314801 RepID=A0A6G1KSB8_9PLEO|nr:NACHT domain-containing protein [Pleomassaria siparia CBS 279.74]
MISPVRTPSSRFNGAGGVGGVFSPPQSPKSPFRSQGRLSSFSSFSKRSTGPNGFKMGLVQESAAALQKKSTAELGAGVYQGISDMSYIRFLEWVRSERLTALPHKGSRWDKVLIRAVYFAEQLHNFDQAIQGFALDSTTAAAIGFGHARLLLELSHANSEALDRAFSVFHKFAMSFSSVLRRSELLAATPEIREQLCLLYTDLLSLVVDVAVRFYKTVNGMTSGHVSLDIFELFGDTIDSFRTRQNSVIDLVWDSQIENESFEEGEALGVRTLSRWLAPEDRVLASLNRDYSTFVDQQVEFTCIWFQKHLSSFVQSDNTFLLITGLPGAGKTTLAGSIVERLQRPVNRQQFDTIFCSLSPGIPTTATSLAIVKSLLLQLLNLRVGNMHMYYALSRAYQQCRATSDLKTYEEHLWQALADTLQHPVDGGSEVIMVVDGLDEIAESQSASIQASGAISPAAVLEKLVNVTSQGHRVRLITLSSSIKMPSGSKGSQHQIVSDDIRDDIHAVALRALIHNHAFHGQKTFEQEAVLDRIIQAAKGSFLWTILACETLNTQKSHDALIKTIEGLEKSKPSINDLVLKVFTSLNVTEHAKTLVSWILAAERPLTIDEIHILFTIDVQRGTLSDTGIDVNKILEALKPLLTLHERIVRFKHPLIHSSLHDLAKHNKVPIPLKESETDLLLRVLMYAKLTLRDKGEPSMDVSDPSIADRLFHQHHFLEYTSRYWVLHLQQSPLSPKSGTEYKPTSDLQKVMPETTTLPILEQLCWDTQLPIPHAVDLHKLVLSVRSAIFTENHSSVLQTYLAIATNYQLISNTTEAQKYFYHATVISRKILSDIHPLTLECANQYLHITETTTMTSRTEIATRREEILILLIAAYERQYGSTSEMVVQTRKLLVELYISINEEDRATDVYRLIQEATIQQYGRNSHEVRDIQGHLGVTLGKGKSDRHIDGYAKRIFDDDDEEETLDVLDIGSAVNLLHKAESQASRNELALAEKQYVELWTEVSSKCRTVQSIEWHEHNISIATALSRLLKSQKRTAEASAILACIWQQYEHHHLSFAESIVSRLTAVAKELKTMGSYTQALSIFKFASSYYKNVRQEESTTSREVNLQVSETSSELVKQSLASSATVTETTSTVSESVFQEVFFSIINSSKTVDAQTIALAKKLTIQYMEKRNYTAAINVIHATLQRTWSSFNSTSIHSVTMPTIFVKESIDLVERLAECYMHTRQFEKVESTYSRFFRAVLITDDVDEAVFEKAKSLLITFYDKHGYPDKAISVFQEILVASKTELGDDHELTIQTLYILARRCQRHPRNHPYWIDYYRQIITILNKDSDVCHKDALDAIIIVSSTYWEDRRYAEAVSIYRVLWNTFLGTTKVHKQFSEVSFVQRLYEQYYQCLEETKASWDVLYRVTKEYRETSISLFGADSTIAIEATLALAQVSQRSEKHISQAISLYEEASKSSKVTTTKTSVTEMKQALSSLYVRQMRSQSSSSEKSENVQRAISITEEQLTEARTKYGYSHESSLTHLKELVVLQHRQKKTDVAVKQLTTAVSEIVIKETSSQKLMESAASIASSFQAIEQVSTAQSLVQELHRQICAKERHESKWSFDLTKTNRSALAFLASLQYNLRRDISITFAEIMADLTLEYIYFEQFQKTLRNNESLTNILLAAAPLRWFLRRNDQKEMITVVENQACALFVKRDAHDLKTLSKESPRIFIIGILDHLGNGKNKNFIRSVILASNDSVTKLTKAKKFPEAYDIANLGFIYASKNDGYNGPRAIGMGFKLASLLVGRDGEKCTDAALRKKMLELSNRIVRKILDICKKMEINFAQVQLYELSQLSLLLAEHEDYETLEWLLTTLWNTRDAQRSWPAKVLLNLGRRLIAARYLAGHPVKAIRLCEDIAYNMRRAHGPRAPVTIETYELLAELYTSTGQAYQAKAATEKTGPLAQDYFKKAVGVHEDILRLMLYDHGSGDDSDDELDTTAYLLAKEGVNVRGDDGKRSVSLDEDSIDKSAIAIHHFQLLKLAYQRFGGWPKSYAEYERLNAHLFRSFGSDSNWKGVQGTEKWDAKPFGSGKAESKDGEFSGIKDWAFGSDKIILHAQNHPRDDDKSNDAANGASNGSTSVKLLSQENGHSNGHSNGLGLSIGKARPEQPKQQEKIPQTA